MTNTFCNLYGDFGYRRRGAQPWSLPIGPFSHFDRPQAEEAYLDDCWVWPFKCPNVE